MTDTINDMELRFADKIYPNQLMEGDLIKLDGDFYTVKHLDENEYGFNVNLVDEYEETLDTYFFDDEQIELYVFVE